MSTINDQSFIASRNFGPITSIFTPPASCLSTLTYFAAPTIYFGRYANGFFDASCFPSARYGDYSETNSWNLYYYSPAVSCPFGWNTVARYSTAFGGFSNTMLSVDPNTTAALCCPSSYTAGDAFGHQCFSTLSASRAITYISVSTSGVANQWVTKELYTTTVPSSQYTFYGDGIPIWYQESDQVAFSAASKASLSDTIITSTTLSSSATQAVTAPNPILPVPSLSSMLPLSTSTSTSANTPPSPSPIQGGLSTTAKAGIAVGASVLSIGMGIAAVFVFLGLRKKKVNGSASGESLSAGKLVQTHEVEKYGSPVCEAGGFALPHEVDGNGSQIYEIAGSAAMVDQLVLVR